MIRTILLVMISTLFTLPASAQMPDVNYDESLVPSYQLPDPLRMSDGTSVTSASSWWDVRRPQVLASFETEVYGRAPNRPDDVRFEVIASDSFALGGAATRKQVSIHFGEGVRPRIDLLMYLPNDRSGPVPAFLGLNFYGNHTIYPDAGITMSDQWMMNSEQIGTVENRATPATRGARVHRWPVPAILDRGYALVTAYYGDIDPDFDDGFRNGVHALYGANDGPAPDEWGSIATWAWGLSRALDYLETDDGVDAERVAVIGHSRLGKAALWAGARDQRFAMVISNNSGCGGAALSRRRFGETVARINESFPHWFSDNFTAYNDREDELPVDQHMLLALIAPRPLYVASAQDDLWADPRGEFLSALHADPVYRLLGTEGLPIAEMPGVLEPAMGTMGYHIRTGEHDVTPYDWMRFLDFADRHLTAH